ncbi:MAG: hypothetical protein AAGF46_10845 [Pseudomonadota bacterium]
MLLRKSIKFLHTIGGAGYGGGLAAYMAMLAFTPDITTIAEHQALRGGLAGISGWIILPSMGICIVSGLLSMAVHHPFQNAPWAWIKALSGVLVFESTLVAIDGPAKAAAKIYNDAAAGVIDAAKAADLVRDEWMAWWILLGLAIANVLLAVMRPSFKGFGNLFVRD